VAAIHLIPTVAPLVVLTPILMSIIAAAAVINVQQHYQQEQVRHVLVVYVLI